MNIIPVCSANPKQMARLLARFATRALYFEVKAHPKPGLVSFVCNGAHQDMNGELFYRSLFSLRHYFYQLLVQDAIESRFEILKSLAIQAEERMLVATHGVNTHRGALFALGLICVSTARLAAIKPAFTPLDLHQQIIDDWHATLANHALLENSHGSQVFQKHPIVGAKQMAMQGYGVVFNLLGSFVSLLEQGESLDASCLYAYAILLAEIDDTNILYRKDKAGLAFAKQKANQLLLIDCVHKRRLFALSVHSEFVSQQISPGGVGDLLAVLLFLGQLFHAPLRKLNGQRAHHGIGISVTGFEGCAG